MCISHREFWWRALKSFRSTAFTVRSTWRIWVYNTSPGNDKSSFIPPIKLVKLYSLTLMISVPPAAVCSHQCLWRAEDHLRAGHWPWGVLQHVWINHVCHLSTCFLEHIVILFSSQNKKEEEKGEAEWSSLCSASGPVLRSWDVFSIFQKKETPPQTRPSQRCIRRWRNLNAKTHLCYEGTKDIETVCFQKCFMWMYFL